MKVKITLPGGPRRVASHSALWTAASRAPRVTGTTGSVVSDAATRETARPPTMPRTTRVRIPALAEYGRLCA
jgi:hypothetical protein